MAKWTTTCFGPYWPSSGCLKRTGLGSYYMHCARTRGVEISTWVFFYLQKLFVAVNARIATLSFSLKVLENPDEALTSV